MKIFEPRCIVLMLLLALAASSVAQADLNVSTVSTITFGTGLAGVVADGGYTGAGFSPAPASGSGRLDSNSWALNGTGAGGGMATLEFGQTRISGVYSRDTSPGGVTSEGFYAFDVDNTSGVNYAFGVQSSNGTFTPGTLTLRVKNTSGATATDWSVAYDIFTWNDANRSQSIQFMYSTTDTTGIGDNTSYTHVAALDFQSPAAATGGSWSAATPKSTGISVTVPDGGFLYLRWAFDDFSGTGDPRDELALDNISVAITAIPEPNAVLLVGLVSGLTGLSVVWKRFRASRITGGVI